MVPPTTPLPGPPHSRQTELGFFICTWANNIHFTELASSSPSLPLNFLFPFWLPFLKYLWTDYFIMPLPLPNYTALAADREKSPFQEAILWTASTTRKHVCLYAVYCEPVSLLSCCPPRLLKDKLLRAAWKLRFPPHCWEVLTIKGAS